MKPRFDTLFLRLFLLMWAVLVVSHLVAFNWVVPLRPGEDADVLHRLTRGPAVPSLPPVGPLLGADRERRPPPPAAEQPAGAAPGERAGRPARPVRSLWWDYGLRALLIGVGAWLGARWLSAPMRRLAQAADDLPRHMAQGQPAPVLDERMGTVEVRDTARVFNRMAEQLQRQFDQRSLHMAAISHDLRTPLTRLRLRLEGMASPVGEAAVADLREMDELIENSLQVVHEQSGGSDAVVVDLGALVQSLVDDLVEQGRQVQLDADAQAGAQRVRVRAHPASLRRMLDNLVGNALRYGQSARLQMRVEDGLVQVDVDDDGPGIPPERMAQVFEPWVSLPRTARPGGNGLGLAIARDLARREGGDIVLANRPQGGLRASLRLPAVSGPTH